jgi:drug/metabolite transporter (DMT)-like permease
VTEARDPQTGRIVAGLFLCLLGICMVAVGGGCTIMWLIFGTGGGLVGLLLLLLCIVAFVLGIVVLRQAMRMVRPAPPPEP